MASTLTDTKAKIGIATFLTAAVDLGRQESKFAFDRALSFAHGTGANAADLLYQDTDTIAASGTRDIDLAGTLLDALGAACVFARVKLVAVYAAVGNTNNVVVGAAAATQWVGPFGAATHTIAVQPGGFLMFATPSAAGWAVGAGATDLLRITNSAAGTGVTYDIVILGASA